MKKSMVFISVLFLVFSSLFCADKKIDDKQARLNLERTYVDTILKYDRVTIEKAMIQLLQKNSVVNKKQFLQQIRKIKGELKEDNTKLTGMANINRVVNGLDGWSVTFVGILIVFVGLLIILVAVQIFNVVFGREASQEKVEDKHVNIFEEVKKASTASVPEEELVAIATALEIYKRLYADTPTSRLTFKQGGQGTWRMKYKFGHRQNIRG